MKPWSPMIRALGIYLLTVKLSKSSSQAADMRWYGVAKFFPCNGLFHFPVFYKLTTAGFNPMLQPGAQRTSGDLTVYEEVRSQVLFSQ